MQPIFFEESISKILKKDRRFDPQAYFFLKEALDFTLKGISEREGGKSRHVSGRELLQGFRDFAIQQFGPMAATLMQEWGVTEGKDVGGMVFLLIEEQVFGRQDSDTIEDFDGHFDLIKSLQEPFLPKRQKVV